MALNLQTESNPERLRHVARVLEAQMAHLLRVLADQSRQLETLTGHPVLQLALEELNEVQPGVTDTPADQDGDAQSEKPAKEKPKRPGHGPKPQPLLEKVTRRYEHDSADMTCPQCGDPLKAFEGQYETSEMIDVIDVTYQLVTVERQKYICNCGACVETAPGPDRAVDGGRYSLEVAVKVALDKYLYHLPLERQVRVMAEHGLDVTSQTLWDMVWTMSRLAKPTYDAILAHILDSHVIGLDQTGWPNLKSKRAKKWQMWCLTAKQAVYHQIYDDKGASTFTDLVGGFEGFIVCDDLSTHQAGARDGPGITLAGCWAHIRRRFAEAEPNFPQARVMLDMIKEMYEIDARAETLEERGRLRATESRDVLKRMLAWLHAQRLPKTTALGAAVRHTVSIWPRLKQFAGAPDVWLDNNPTERGIRGPVVGRRNHFGSKSRRGTEAAAILYTLIETAKVCGKSPTKYLLEVAQAAKRDATAIVLPFET